MVPEEEHKQLLTQLEVLSRVRTRALHFIMANCRCLTRHAHDEIARPRPGAIINSVTMLPSQ